MTASRIRPDNRRRGLTIDVAHGPPAARQFYAVNVGMLKDGSPIEIFISVKKKAGSDVEAVVRDCAILASLAIQYGAPLEELRAAVTRDDDGSAATVIGSALDAILEERAESPAAA